MFPEFDLWASGNPENPRGTNFEHANFPCALKGEAGKATDIQVPQQKYIRNYRNVAYDKTSINMGTTTCGTGF